MQVLKRGHVYALAHRGGDATTRIGFVNREPGQEVEGVTTQEILRMLIDRTRYCNNCQPHPNNARIIEHFRMALVLHEARALERKVLKGEMEAEHIDLGEDGHFAVSHGNSAKNALSTDTLDPYLSEGQRPCAHRSHE